MKHTPIHTFLGWWWWKINSCVRYETVGTGRKGEGGMEVGEEGDYYTYRYTVTTIKMGSDEGHFNVLLIVRDKVTECPQTTILEVKGEPKQIRTEVPLLTSLPPYR